ncbi:MAG: T9SS type A sorting domain-containing protein [Bacteroidia bacterium]
MKNKYVLSFLLFSLLETAIIAQPYTFLSKGIGGGGALFSLSINPANNNEYYVACDMGELFHTTNYGSSYSQVSFNQLIAGHNSKICYTSTAGLLYCINYANDKVIPVKSADNGITWTALAHNPDDGEETYSIDVDYNHLNRILISYYGKIYFSSNGGISFTSIHTAATNSGNVVAGVFFDNDTIYIGTNDGVLVSTNAGATFALATIAGLPVNERIWSFAGAKVGNLTRFFCITADVADVYVGVVGSDYNNFMKGVYSVDYKTGKWISKMTGITAGTDYPMFVAMAQNDISTVYLAGSNSNSEPNLLKTINGGTSWSPVFNTANNKNINTGWSGDGGNRGWSYGECAFSIAVAPNNANNVAFSDLGFVHKTINGGATWQQAYVDISGQHPINTITPAGKSYKSVGLENTTCWQIHWINATNMWACFSDIRGIRSTDAGNSWSFDYTGNTANSSYRIVQHPTNTTLYAATSNIHDIYQSTRLQDAQLDATDANGKIIYSTNNGKTWQNLHVFNHPVFWLALDPTNSNRAYASVIHYNGGNGIGGIYVCNDLQNLAASTWTLLPNPPRTEKHPASIVVLNDGKMVCTYSGRRTTTFTASSGVFIYDPVTTAFTDVSDPGMKYWTTDIVIDPIDATQNTWYVGVFSGWGGSANGLGGLYKTTNRGVKWTRITNPAVIDRVTSCTFNPNNPNQLYITTETQGLWVSSNINDPSPTFTLVNAYPFQQPERVFFNPYNKNEIWISSFGNGIKMATLLPTGNIKLTDSEKPLNVFPNPTNGPIYIKNTTAHEVLIYNVLGSRVSSIPLNKENPEIDITYLDKGIYFLVCENKRVKIILNK